MARPRGASPPLRWRRSFGSTTQLGHVFGGRSLLPLDDIELDALTFRQGLEASALDCGMMNEAILLSVLGRDEPEALRIVEPFYSASRPHRPTPSRMCCVRECGMPYRRTQRG